MNRQSAYLLLRCYRWIRCGYPLGHHSFYQSPFAMIAILSFSPLVTKGAEGGPTVRELLDSWKLFEQQVFESDSMLIRYERDSSVAVHPEIRKDKLLLLEWTTGYLNSSWYSKRRFFTLSGDREERVYEQPFTNVVKHGLVVEHDSGHKSAVVGKIQLGMNTYRDMDYFRNIWLNAPLYIARSLGVEDRMESIRDEFPLYVDIPFLPEFVEQNRDRYQVLDTLEQVGGVDCRVIEWPGMDKIWVDPSLGYSVRRRVVAWSPGGPLRQDIVASDFREVKAGVWLPFRQIELRYFDPRHERPKANNKVRYRATYNVLSVEFNSLDQSFFDVTLPHGTAVFDAPRNFRYVVSDTGADPLDAPIEIAKDRLDKLSDRNRRSHLWLLLTVNIVVCLVALFYVLLKRLRN